MSTHQPERIISGGQTGIDQLGLEVARSLGIPTGGLAPRMLIVEFWFYIYCRVSL
ncbi:YpsA SLOG family protein [Spirosoma endophyticum]|uniref:Putative molybdenum carrier n=1 Tax=Spirosoma endophyticum TaxID=662367 RepID=A0A1I2H342_9BACT|nr:putative molybdenum carrier protein [Spirosoma endophyticum]SFF23216.1 Putative molybdenum carrier [Spirosoma endophyticum]